MQTPIVTIKALQGFYHSNTSTPPLTPAHTVGYRIGIQEITGHTMLKFGKGKKTVIIIVPQDQITESYRIATKKDLF